MPKEKNHPPTEEGEVNDKLLFASVILELKKQQWNNLVADNELIHQHLQYLINDIETLVKQQASKMPEKSKEAAVAMLSDLKFLQRSSDVNIPTDFETVLMNTFNIIQKYETPLEAAPGFFNQFKSLLNSFVEKLTGVKDLLPVEKIGTVNDNASFQKTKDDIKNLKQEKLGNPVGNFMRFFQSNAAGPSSTAKDTGPDPDHESEGFKQK
jgi:hypothetical protein